MPPALESPRISAINAKNFVNHHSFVRRLLKLSLSLPLLLFGAHLAILSALVAIGHSPSEGVRATELQTLRQLFMDQRDGDSWKAMANGYEAIRKGDNVYQGLYEDAPNFFKYQYPPTALLPFAAAPEGGASGPRHVEPGSRFHAFISLLSRIAVLATTVVAGCIALTRARQILGERMERRHMWTIATAVGVAGLGFHPLLYAHEIGQIQVFINLSLSLALMAWMAGNSSIAGILVGVCCLIKPQYGLVLAWAALAGRWRFLLSGSAMLGAGLLASVTVFGLGPHLSYVEALQHLSRHGEAYWPNQSMNGLMNRLLSNGDAVRFGVSPPYHPLVYGATLLSSSIIVLAALLPLWARRRHLYSSSHPIDKDLILAFAAILAASTLASPVAWEHHYGLFLAITSLLLPSIAAQPDSGRRLAALYVVSFLAIACLCRPLTHLLDSRFAGLAVSHVYFGALVLTGIILYLDRMGMDKRPRLAPALR